MKKSIFTSLILAGILFTSCSNLFESFVNTDGSPKSGDSGLIPTDTTSTYTPGSDETSVEDNESPESFYEFTETAKEFTNTELSAGIVVIKSSMENYNQINFSKDVYTYEIGYELDDSEETVYSSPVYLNGYDDPVTIKTFKNDKNAIVQYSAVQTRTTNIEPMPSDSSTFINPQTESFVDLSTFVTVPFSVNTEEEGEPLVFDYLPYGTTQVTIKITADDDYYSDEYVIILNKKHLLTSLVLPETVSVEKTKLTTGLVALKESDNYVRNIIEYEDGVLYYEVGSEDDVDALLTDYDKNLYVKAIPASSKASVSWSAKKIAEPVYRYDYYQTTTTTVVITDSDGILISGPDTSSATVKLNYEAETGTTSETSEEENADGSTTTTTVTRTIRKNIVGLDHMEELPESIDLTESSVFAVENQNTDRVRRMELPYGLTEVKAVVSQYDLKEKIYAEYIIRFSRVQFSLAESTDSESSDSSVEDDTSKLEDLTVTTKETVDDNGESVDNETESVTSFTFDRDVTIYSIVVDEETDEIIINPTLTDTESMTNPVSTTKNAVIQFEDTSVPLQGGLQTISFTVTEEGCESRTYTIYVYKIIGNTKLSKIYYASYDCIADRITKQDMASNAYSSGLSAMTPAAVKSSNGGTIDSPLVYKIYARADSACDVSSIYFNIVPDDSHTHVYYSTDISDESAWSSAYLGSEEESFAENTENASSVTQESYRFALELLNDSSLAQSDLWIKTESRAYNHAAADGTVSFYSDVTYHKIEVYKPGSENKTINYLYAAKIGEDKTTEEKIYTYQTTSDVRYTIPQSIPQKELGTDYDVLKLKFRLSDRADSVNNKKVTYSAVNTRSSDTCGIANTEFPGYAADTETGRIEITAGSDGLYTLTLGENAVESIVQTVETTTQTRTAADGEVSGSTTEVSVTEEKDNGRVVRSTKTTVITDTLVSDGTANITVTTYIQVTTYTFKDFPMGTTQVKIYVDDELSQTLTFTKPDRDTFELDNTPSSLTGLSGSYQYKNGIFYINNDVESISLTVKMHQKNQSLYVKSYKKVSGLNGSEESETFANSLVTFAQVGSSREWTSDISAIPVGTSVVTYGVSNSNGEMNDNAFTVTIVRAADEESRLRSFTLSEYPLESEDTYAEKASEIFKQGSGFTWSDGGTLLYEEENTSVYYNFYEKTIPTAKYSAFLQTVSETSLLEAELYASYQANLGRTAINNALGNRTESQLFESADDYQNNDSDKWQFITQAAVTNANNYQSANFGDWIISEEDYVFYLVHAKVTSADGSNIHHYYLLMSVELDDTTELSVNVNQYANPSSTQADSEGELTEGDINSSDTTDGSLNVTNKNSTFTTDLNRTGKIFISAEKNETASWYCDPEVYLYNSETGLETSLDSSYYSINSESQTVEISSDIYEDDDIPGNEIHIKYGVISQNRLNVLYHTAKVFVSTFQTITTYNHWSKSEEYSYTLAATDKQYQLAFRFGSKITDNNHPVVQNSLVDDGGIDVIASKDYGTNWAATSYNFSGLHYVVEIDDVLYLVKLESDTDDATRATATNLYKIEKNNGLYQVNVLSDGETPDLTLTVSACVQYDGEKPYLSITSQTSSQNSVKLGLVMDTLVADDEKATDSSADSVTISATNNGFEMEGDGYIFSLLLKNALGVTDVDGYWYGSYHDGLELSYFENVFNPSAVSSSTTDDSALSFFWNLNPGNNTKSIRLSVE